MNHENTVLSSRHNNEPFSSEKFLLKKVTAKENLDVFSRGLFAEEPIHAHEHIFSFKGTYVSKESATHFALQVGKGIYLESDPNAEYENCINHACHTQTHKPNCKLLFNFTRPMEHRIVGQRSQAGEVVLVAQTEIKAGEQLFFEYAVTEENMDDPYEGQMCSFECNCGIHCRGHISGFANLSLDQAQLLYPHMSPYIQGLVRAKFSQAFFY